ncbi:hypothetical protein NBT05_15570 [Aquimarina sp. ERC-38]|uniref:hypothetical protein n=1 Tax=Aquimarina sp. ERC-38 TaxID=2949996 RepID=UPI002247EB07|nr:hypothetical protein [Aquimarina sp. ERC-38]UZO80362.1 hypothetical protein NBT05_15570 [Aquimarina sp. ERC-38]
MKTCFTFFVTVLFLSCNQPSKKEQQFDQLMNEVIAVHDEVMPKMTDMSQLISELKQKTDTTATGLAYGEAKDDLEASYDFMMEWMRDFSDKFPPEEVVTEKDEELFNKKLQMLEEEKVEVTLLKDQINTSIENAKALLGQ